MPIDHWKIALDIEMIQWGDLIDSIDNLIWWISASPNHIAINYEEIESGWIDV